MINLLCAGACDNLGILHLRPFSGLECRLAAGKDLSRLPEGLLLHIRTAGCVLPVFCNSQLERLSNVWSLPSVLIHTHV